jgi:DNA-binding transcriptional LysR family regulator
VRTDYLGLEAFVAIADLGSFHRAASFLNLSQAALSHRIRKLETELGIPLFVRTTRDVSLTKEAQEVLPEVRRSLKRLGDSYASLSGLGRDRSARLSFACLPTLSINYLPGVLRAFSDRYPGIVVRLQDCAASLIYEMVNSDDVEFGLTIIGARHWDLDIREIYTEPYVLYVRRDDPLASRASVRRSDLVGRTFVQINTQSSNRQLVDEALGSVRSDYVWRYHVQNAAMALRLVAEGAAITILPALMESFARPELVALPFSDVRMTRTIGVVTRRGASLSVPARHLIGLLETRLSERSGDAVTIAPRPPD